MMYEYWQSKRNGKWYWRLRARNGKVIASHNQGYGRRAACIRMIKIVRGENLGRSILGVQR